MYESPIVQKMQEITNWMMEERENGVMLKVTETIGYDIDKGELIRALNYDRDQYTKGYKEAEKEMIEMLDKIRAEIEKECKPCIYEIDFAYKKGLSKALEIIDKYGGKE